MICGTVPYASIVGGQPRKKSKKSGGKGSVAFLKEFI